MAAHFTYKHLPAAGLGNRDPLRPYSTGGLGGAVRILIYVVEVLEQRIYRGSNRTLLTNDRALLTDTRDFIVANRDMRTSDRDRVRLARIFADVESALTRMDREMSTDDRTYRSADRDLN